MTKQMSSYDFIAEFQKGNFLAIADLYREHHVSLTQFAEQLIHDPQESDDIVLDTFIKLMRRRMHFDSAINIKAFLYITVRNACLGFLGYQQQTPAISKAPAAQRAEEKDDDYFDPPEVRMAAIRSLYEAVEAMPPVTRDVFKLLFIKGELNTEVARQLSIAAAEVLHQRIASLRFLQQHLIQKDNWSVPLLIYFLAVECPEKKPVEV